MPVYRVHYLPPYPSISPQSRPQQLTMITVADIIGLILGFVLFGLVFFAFMGHLARVRGQGSSGTSESKPTEY